MTASAVGWHSHDLTLSLLTPVEIPSGGNYHQIYDPPINMELLINPHDGFAPDKEYLIGVSEITVTYTYGNEFIESQATVLLRLPPSHRQSLHGPERDWYFYINGSVYEFQLELGDQIIPTVMPFVVYGEQYIYKMPYCMKRTDAKILADEFNEESEDRQVVDTDMVTVQSPLMSCCRTVFIPCRACDWWRTGYTLALVHLKSS